MLRHIKIGHWTNYTRTRKLVTSILQKIKRVLPIVVPEPENLLKHKALEYTEELQDQKPT